MPAIASGRYQLITSSLSQVPVIAGCATGLGAVRRVSVLLSGGLRDWQWSPCEFASLIGQIAVLNKRETNETKVKRKVRCVECE